MLACPDAFDIELDAFNSKYAMGIGQLQCVISIGRNRLEIESGRHEPPPALLACLYLFDPWREG